MAIAPHFATQVDSPHAPWQRDPLQDRGFASLLFVAPLEMLLLELELTLLGTLRGVGKMATAQRYA